jgi:hypothetical protein
MVPDLLTPIALGLPGFIEPCSLGANAIFLGYVMPLSGWRRVEEACALGCTLPEFLVKFQCSPTQEESTIHTLRCNFWYGGKQ